MEFLIPVILSLVVGSAVILIAMLFFEEILDWFTDRKSLKTSDVDNIAFTIKEKLQDGDYKVVQGIFNTRTSEIVDQKVYQSEEIDEELKQTHGRNSLVVYR